jgi:hypothetical protein
MAAVGGSSKRDAFTTHPKFVYVAAGAIGRLLDFRILTGALTTHVRNLTNDVRGPGASSRHSRWSA